MTKEGSPLEVAWIKRILGELSGCGVDATQVDLRYSDEIQDYDVVIDGLGSAGWLVQFERLALLGDAEKLNFVFLEPDAFEKHHRARKPLDDRQEAEHRAAVRAKLADNGFLELIPAYDPTSQTLSAYAEALERLSGLEPGSVLSTKYPGMLAIVSWPTDVADKSAISRLYDFLTVSNLHENGVRVGLIGMTAGPD